MLNSAALLELHGGDGGQAAELLGEAYPAALATQDMPIVATVGIGVASLAVHRQ